MITGPAICVHSLSQARLAVRAARALERRVVLISAEGAASFAGCLWWLELVRAATQGLAEADWSDWLDCADAAGHAMAALRAGQRRLILRPQTPAFAAVCGAAASVGAVVETVRPPHLDLARSVAPQRLQDWLLGATGVPAG